MSSATAKLKEYVAFGVRNVSLIDPKQRTVYVADVDGLHEVSGARVTLKTVGGTTTIDFNEIFAELD